WFLRTVVPFWPEGTIFVCVVDPGVGTDRKIVAARADGKFFLAPDNGLLTFVTPEETRSVENAGLFLPSDSTTFHGRDRFAPVAAALANGLALGDVGPAMGSLAKLNYRAPEYSETVVRGTVVGVDRFGNLITDIERSRLPFDSFELQARSITIERIERHYAGAEPGPFLIVGSTGLIEISVANGSAADRLGIRRLDRITIQPRPPHL
ncbi:MAG: SAM hydrolase/SAM-dependent halogenase family protein, partial [Thermoanaerobaculia bacterium]